MHDHHPQRSSRQPVPSEEAYPRNPAMDPSYSRTSPSRQHSEESWIDITSRPSSSSLSSAADEIITTGLTVQHDSNLHRRNRRPRGSHFEIGTGRRVTSVGGGNSSQEEYDESESESDRVMTSSNEHARPSPLRQEVHHSPRGLSSTASSDTMSEREEEDDDDENATAVNYPRSNARHFQPRPNAFSHSNAEHAVRSQSGTVYTPRRPATRPGSQRQHSYPQHTPYNVISPSHQADHDEALRASLSTLLSAAAAVRGLPKPGQPRVAPVASSSRVDPTSLRMVPESVALGEIAEETSNDSSSRATSPSDKPKRKASPAIAGARSSSGDRHAVKKARKQSSLIEEISPTLFTWVVSAGVVVLVSALSFSAGYVVGNEAGYAEAMGQVGAVGSEAGSCGKEAVRGTGLGLRRLRWTGGTVVRA